MLTSRQWAQWRFAGSERWSDWTSLTREGVDMAPSAAGAYVFALPVGPPLQRWLGDDPHGLLGIGESGNLRRRLRALWASASIPGTPGHMAGWRLGKGLLRRAGLRADQLRFSWQTLPDKKAALEMESRLLSDYVALFGEQPPLNYKANWAAQATA